MSVSPRQRAVLGTALLLVACDPAPPARATDGASSAAETGTSSANGSATATADPAREACVVATVTDGDSFRCQDGRRIRLLLLDAPEMSQPPFGTRARDALRKRLPQGDTAWLEFDLERTDQYDRTLAHIWSRAAGGTHVNLAQAADGWAVDVFYRPNVRYREAIQRAVAQARESRLGLWTDGAYRCEPAAHKRKQC